MLLLCTIYKGVFTPTVAAVNLNKGEGEKEKKTTRTADRL